MKLTGQQINELMELSYSLEGKEVRVSESLSCRRQAGHDRHFATQTNFSLLVKYVGGTISGTRIIFSV